jgi:hypothetical protein
VDWHRLVRRYGDPATHPGSDDSLRDAAGIDNGPAPAWSTVAGDYDGVHRTFAGLLTGLYVPQTTEEVSTTLWAGPRAAPGYIRWMRGRGVTAAGRQEILRMGLAATS